LTPPDRPQSNRLTPLPVDKIRQTATPPPRNHAPAKPAAAPPKDQARTPGAPKGPGLEPRGPLTRG